MASTMIGRLTYEITGDSSRLNSELGKADKKVGGLTNTLKKAGVAIGAFFALDKIKDFGVSAVKSAGQFEQLQIAFTTFLKDADKANATLAELEDFSVVTPFTIDQVNKAGKSLLAFGFGADELTETLTKLGNISAGTGKDFNELATLVGKARVQTTIYSEDINQFVEAGIPIIDEFAKILGVSTSEVKKLASEGQISFKTLQTALDNISTGSGQFAGLIEAQSESLLGRISTLQGNFSLLARNIGEKLVPVVGFFVDGLNDLLTGSDDLKGSTDLLISSNKELKTINQELTDTSKELNEQERQTLELRKAQIKVDIINSLQNLNDIYKENQKLIKTGNFLLEDNRNKQKDLKQELDELSERSENATNRYNRLNKLYAEGALNADGYALSLSRVNASKEASEELQIKEKKLREELNALRAEESRALAEQGLEVAEYNDSVAKLAEALNQNIITETNLLGLSEPLREAIIEKSELLKEEAEKRKEIDDDETQNAIDNNKKKAESEEELAKKKKKLEEDIRKAKKDTADNSIALAQASGDLALAVLDKVASEEQKKTDEFKAINKGIFLLQKGLALAQVIINGEVAKARALAELGPVAGLVAGRAIDIGTIASGVLIGAQTIAGFEKGGVIRGLNQPIGREDGLIAVQNNEAVLNKQATANLGEDGVNALNNGGSLNTTIIFQTQSGEELTRFVIDKFNSREILVPEDVIIAKT